MKRLFLIGFFLLSWFGALGQEKYPRNSFRSPLGIPLVLSGTFGELRSNHFHGGIDIKTQQRQGLPIYAIADGTVTRIKVGLFGYGKALYVAHPNGFTSVYAHLQKYGPKIQEYIKKIQYLKRKFGVEVFPEYGELKVNKGDIIAYTGNTGGSFGPHLHFEIRNSATQKPINPLFFGFDVQDATPPQVVGLYGYPLSNGSHINGSNKRIQLNFTKQPNGTFLADKVTALGTIGFGFNGFDRQDMAANKNGVFTVSQHVNGRLSARYDFETFAFDETRFINTFIDYEYYKKHNRRIQKLFREPANDLSIYKEIHDDGKIQVAQGESYNVALHIADIAGNAIKVVIPIEGKKEKVPLNTIPDATKTLVRAQKPNSFDLGTAKVFFPAGTFYKDFHASLDEKAGKVSIHNNSVATHRNYTLSFDVSTIGEAERSQLFIAHLGKEGPRYCRTYKKGDTFSTRTKELGNFTLLKDSVPPKIRPRNFKPGKWLTNYKYLRLTIADDLSGINSYDAYLNGKWILMEYEPKNRTLTYNFDDKIAQQTQCQLKVVVTDNVGNTRTFEATFFRK